MKKIISQINTILREKTKLKPNTSCICGISGGQDSVLLFFLLLHLKKQWNLNIHLLHFNHLWQQKNFFSSQQLWKLAFSFENPIYINISNVFLNNEKKAREWRQKGLQRISYLEKCNNLLTGHTASDRIETSFWHLIRGTSPQGFLSLKWQTTLTVNHHFFNFPIFLNIHSKNCFLFCKKQFFETDFFTSFEESLDFLVCKKKLQIKKNKKFKTMNFYKLKNKKIVTKVKKACSYQTSTNKKKFTNTIFLISSTNQKIFDVLEKKGPNLQSSVLIENYYTVKRFFLEKQQQNYTFVTFNLFFSKKNFLRPLLIFHRTDVTLFAKKYLLPIISDPSNQKLCWSRNRIRYQLVPLIRFFFNPQIDYLLNNFLEISIQEYYYIDFLMQKIFYSVNLNKIEIKETSFYKLNTQKIWSSKKVKLFWKEEKLNYNKNYFFDSKKLIQNDIQKLPKALQKRFLTQVFQSYTKLQLNLIQIDHLLNIFEKS